MKRLLLFSFLAIAPLASAQNAFFNEFHYDNAGTDVGEFIEVAILTSEDATDYTITLYNGSNNATYGTVRNIGSECSTLGTQSGGYTLYLCSYPENGIQNGAPDGIALGNAGSLVEFLSYEGVMTATNGIASGITSTDIGVAELGSDPAGGSIGLEGSPGALVWTLSGDDSPGFLNGGQTALPVELVSFDAIASGSGVTLQWRTASETNNAGFDVQQQQGGAWTTLGFVKGHGTTLEAQQYSYPVASLAAGTFRFRLRQVDFDGAFEFSPEVELTIESAGVYRVSAAQPNPFRDAAYFTLSVQRGQQVTAELYNLLGQRVATLFEGALGSNESRTVSIDGKGLPAGVYLYRVQGETFATSRQVTLMR